MTTKATKQNACPFNVAKQNQGAGKEVLTPEPDKIIPSLETLYIEGIKDLRRALLRVLSTEDADTAKAAVSFALNVGWNVVNRIELIRAVEVRLPAPSPHQRDRCNLLRLVSSCGEMTGEIIYSRVIGAFGDTVILITQNPKSNHPPLIRIMTISATGKSPVAEWDITRPQNRRKAPAAIIDAEATAVNFA
ncbi:hypothetical protein [Methanorbis rubei]